MQTATSETESKSRDLSICVHHYTLRAPCPKGQGTSTIGQFYKNAYLNDDGQRPADVCPCPNERGPRVSGLL